MKTILIILGVVLAGFIISQIYAMSSQRNIETYSYEVIKEYDNIEIRQYEAGLFTSVNLAADTYDNASSKGFRKLGGYIFGANSKDEKIAMTSPVSMSIEDSMTMMFLVPKEYKKEDLPKPNESDIEFKEVPARKMAAITFGGWANDEKIAKYKALLKNELDKQGIKYTDRFFFYGYNAPYEVINRKNEVVVELEESSLSLND